MKLGNFTRSIKARPFRSLLLVSLFSIIGLAGYFRVTYFQWCTPNPLKVTDPDNPRFKPQEFCLANYSDREDLLRALAVTFPPGTDKTKVDEILAQSSCIPERSRNNKWEVRYYCPPKFHPLIYVVARHDMLLFLYSQDDKVINIQPHGGKLKAFQNMPNKHDLRRRKVNNGNP